VEKKSKFGFGTIFKAEVNPNSLIYTFDYAAPNQTSCPDVVNFCRINHSGYGAKNTKTASTFYVYETSTNGSRLSHFACHPKCTIQQLEKMVIYESPQSFLGKTTNELIAVPKEARDNFSRDAMLRWTASFQTATKTKF